MTSDRYILARFRATATGGARKMWEAAYFENCERERRASIPATGTPGRPRKSIPLKNDREQWEQLRHDQGLRQSELARLVGTTQAEISRFERHLSELTPAQMERMKAVLIDGDLEPRPAVVKLAARLKRIYESGISMSKMARLAGMSAATIHRIIHGESQPNDETIATINTALDRLEAQNQEVAA